MLFNTKPKFKMRFFSSILVVLVVVLCYACQLDNADWQPLPEDTRNEQARIKSINYRAASVEWSFTNSYIRHFFYKNDRLQEIQQVGSWTKEYHYNDGLLVSRVTLSWKERDTLQLDSFTYHELPLRLKQKKELIRGSNGRYVEHIYTYFHNPMGEITKITKSSPKHDAQLIFNIEWSSENPTHIITNSLDNMDFEPYLNTDEQYIYDDGLNYEFYKRWDPDELRAKNNYTSYHLSSPIKDLASDGHKQEIEYDKQGYPQRIYRAYCTTCNWVDTLDITYQ
mgnify:CR=1 FL=1